MTAHPVELAALTALIAVAALLSSSVGHAGGSSYLAAMALFGMQPALMKPIALFLNIVVATITAAKFYRAGCFNWRLFWPFAVTSIPFSFIGGRLLLPAHIYKPIVGIVLLFSAVRLFQIASKETAEVNGSVPLYFSVGAGILLGLLSGLTGVGGGIFLSPLLLLMGWADPRTTSATSAAFILVNSIGGLLGYFSAGATIPAYILWWAPVVALFGWIGAEYGSKRLPNVRIRQLLAVVLCIAAGKLLFL